MKYYDLGEGPNALRVSECCLGTMTWGEQNTEEEAHAQLDAALEAGVTFVDAAELYPVPPRPETYGRTEEIIGSWLRKDPSRRGKIVLASKVASRSPGPRLAHIVGRREYPGDQAPTELALTREQILAACEGSLKRLGTTHIDLYQMHWPDRYSNVFDRRAYERKEERAAFTPFEESVKAVGELLAAGKVKQWGVSNENAFGVTKYIAACERLGVQKPVTIQNDFSVVHRKFSEDGSAEACSPLHSGVPGGVRLLAYGALAGGALSGKYERRTDGTLASSNPKSRHVLFPQFQPRYYSGAVIDTVGRLKGLAKELGMSPAELALVWARGQEYMGSIIIGATDLAQLRQNLAAFERPLLTAEELARVDEACDPGFTPYFSRVGELKTAPAE